MDENNAKSAVSRGLLEHTLPAWDELPDFELWIRCCRSRGGISRGCRTQRTAS